MMLRSSLPLLIVRLVLVASVIGCIIPGFAQQNGHLGMGVPNDWTHQHLVFSNPGTFQDAMKNGTYNKWARTVNDPRYQLQQMKRNATLQRAEKPFIASGIEAGPLAQLCKTGAWIWVLGQR